jgi:AbiV family abortive infection protein
MSKKPIRQFSGPLTPRQIADGMNAAARSARRLYEDAEVMAKASRFPTACALAVLSIEEAGKRAVLRQIASAKTDTERKAAWRDYRSHQAMRSFASRS